MDKIAVKMILELRLSNVFSLRVLRQQDLLAVLAPQIGFTFCNHHKYKML